MIDICSRYKHYKNDKIYEIITIAVNPNTNEEFVVYEEINQDKKYVRPIVEFEDKFSATEDYPLMEQIKILKQELEEAFPDTSFISEFSDHVCFIYFNKDIDYDPKLVEIWNQWVENYLNGRWSEAPCVCRSHRHFNSD